MKEEFDFNRIGKRMPYTVPEGSLDDIEKNVWATIKEEKSCPNLNGTIAYGIPYPVGLWLQAWHCCLPSTSFQPIRKPMILQCWNKHFQN